jgi:hypothetical protein
MYCQSFVGALSLGLVALALHDQFPINTTQAGESGARPLYGINSNPGQPCSNSEQWRLDEYPPENATGNLIFDTVHSLLQHWPNTRYRHGTVCCVTEVGK